MLRGTGRGKVLAATQRRCQTVWRDRGHSVGDRYAALLQLFVQIHDHGSLLRLWCMMLLRMMMVEVMVVSSRVQ